MIPITILIIYLILVGLSIYISYNISVKHYNEQEYYKLYSFDNSLIARRLEVLILYSFIMLLGVVLVVIRYYPTTKPTLIPQKPIKPNP